MTGPFSRQAAGCLFKGGLEGDSSESSSTTSNTTTTQDNKVVAGDESFVVTAGATVGDITVESLDADLAKQALAQMTSVAGKSLDANTSVTGKAFDFAGKAGDRAFDFAENTQSEVLTESRALNRAVLDSSNTSISRMSDAYKAAASGNTAQLQDTLKQIAIGGLLTVAVVGGIYAYRKK